MGLRFLFFSLTLSFALLHAAQQMALDICHSARQIANRLRDDPRKAEIWGNVVGAAGESLAVPFRNPPSLDLDKPWIRAKFFRDTLGFFICPRVRRPPRAEAMGINSRADAWRWIAHQVHILLPDTTCQHVDPANNIGATPSRIFRRMGPHRYRLYVHPKMARLRLMELHH